MPTRAGERVSRRHGHFKRKWHIGSSGVCCLFTASVLAARVRAASSAEEADSDNRERAKKFKSVHR
jgi:hypothetical protein